MIQNKLSLSKIEEEIINFARKRNKILAVYHGHVPEEDTRCYYLITRGFSLDKLRYSISDLDIKLHKVSKEYFEILSWPLEPKSKTVKEFHGNEIWRRDSKNI